MLPPKPNRNQIINAVRQGAVRAGPNVLQQGSVVYAKRQVGGRGIPRPTRPFQVYTPLDLNLNPIWTTLRFTDEIGYPVSNASSGSAS